MITDGIENCDGDPCAVTSLLQKKRISLRPFIIGLGVGDEGRDAFDCVGTYINTASRKGFKNALNIVVSKALNTTTVQVNLMDLANQPTETNVELTFYDTFSGETLYNFVHAFDENGNSDTLYLDPIGKYNVTAHTLNSVSKRDIELIPGKHNIIAMDVPQGSLKLSIGNQIGTSSIQCIVREQGAPKIIYAQDLLTTKKYLVGSYDLDILTLPRLIKKGVVINQSQVTEIRVPVAGSLSITAVAGGILSIYETIEGRRNMIYEINEITQRMILKILPGTYQVVYRKNKDKNAYLTEVREVEINSGQYANIKF